MRLLHTILLSLIATAAMAAPPKLDERPAADQEWGYRPASGSVSEVTPPNFSWRPQKGVVRWEMQCAPSRSFKSVAYRGEGIAMNVHTPAVTLPSGDYVWRYRGFDEKGVATKWSQVRSFEIANSATEMPMPPRKELLARIPNAHPRLFMRPEDMPRLKNLAQGRMKEQFEALVAKCERLLKNPPPTAEPPKYGPMVVRNSDEWRKIWWGNRTYTRTTLDSAATLAFTRLLGGKEEYGQLAKRVLLECAEWDPKGATGYRYNDEAGMPYAYYFVRTYTFVNDLLTDDERAKCRAVMKIRGDEMYRHLYPRHLWRPYSSHSNRAWHFLGEIGVALLGEVEDADEWVWFAMNVFYNAYPVWSDDDGGWHEGNGYWSSYVSRFTWWADIMHSAMGISAYDKSYFAKIGYYPLYMMPPGKVGGGFGDLNARRTSKSNVPLVSQVARQAGNGHWQWYAEKAGGPSAADGYVGFVRGAGEEVAAVAPDDLPTSRVFRGIGQAALNSTLTDATQNVQVVFKSSPFGTQSHGYEANNSFLLWAYGQRLLVRSGYRDSYGTVHHKNWMWSTRSVNNITVNGTGQLAHSAAAQGKIVSFETSPSVDIVVGEAGGAYRAKTGGDSQLSRFMRTIVFVKPDLVIVYDRLMAREKSTFEYWLHATEKFSVNDQRDIRLKVKDVGCDISILAPEGLAFRQTDQYDPNPRPRITLREWHLTATTPAKTRQTEFVALYRPHRLSDDVPREASLKRIAGGYVLSAEVEGGKVTALLPTSDRATLRAEGLTTKGNVVVRRVPGQRLMRLHRQECWYRSTEVSVLPDGGGTDIPVCHGAGQPPGTVGLEPTRAINLTGL